MRALLVSVALMVTCGCWAAAEVTLVANGRAIASDPPPLLQEGHVYVPLRAAAEAVGGEVAYDAVAKRVTICRQTMCTVVMQSEGITLNGRLLVGIRRVAEALDAQVGWDGPSKTVRIATSD